jgi:hypothetical protein
MLELRRIEKSKSPLSIEERVLVYKKFFKGSIAINPIKEVMQAGVHTNKLEALTQIRELNTVLADLYRVSIPVITVWVRDNSYVPETGEIFLTEPDLEAFLHQFRHHLQNVERKYERRGLTAEGLNGAFYRLPYEKCIYHMRGEDDAIAWARMLIEEARA